jgi:hypothetical protein
VSGQPPGPGGPDRAEVLGFALEAGRRAAELRAEADRLRAALERVKAQLAGARPDVNGAVGTIREALK